MLRGLLYASYTQLGGASLGDGHCQAVVTTASHIPVALSFCHFVTLGHGGTVMSIFP